LLKLMTQGRLHPDQLDQSHRSTSQLRAGLFRQWVVVDVLVPLAVTRAVLVLVAWLGFHFFQFHLRSSKWEIGSNGMVQPVAEHLSPDAHPFINMWSRWDAGWYLDVAKNGYKFLPGEQSNVAFFPLYPYLTRLIHSAIPVKGDAGWMLGGIIVSNTALLVGLIYLHRLVRLDYDYATAGRAVLYLCVFPTTLFLSAVYSESLFLALVVTAFYYSRSRRWIVSGMLAAAATLCRPAGLLLLLPLGFEYLDQRKFRWRLIGADSMALILIPLAFTLHLAVLRWRFGSWSVISKAEAIAGWDRSLTLPSNTLLSSLQHIGSSIGYHGAFEFFFTAILIALAVLACFRLRPSYAIYSVVSVLFATSWGDLRSAPRFGIVIFPIFILLALMGEHKAFNRMYLTISAVLAAVSMVVFSQWGWVA
jgi:Gpi18-like mannosyltransferase